MRSRLEAHCRALAGCRMCGHRGRRRADRVARGRRPRRCSSDRRRGRSRPRADKPFAGSRGEDAVSLARARRRRRSTPRGSASTSPRSRAAIRVRARAAAAIVCRRPPSRRRARRGSTRSSRIIRPKLLIPVGTAGDRAISSEPSARSTRSVARTRSTHAGGKSLAIPLPHPSGASSWIHQGDHPQLARRRDRADRT